MWTPDEEIIDELTKAHILRQRLIARLEDLNAAVGRCNARLADATARVNELRMLAAAGGLGLDRRTA